MGKKLARMGFELKIDHQHREWPLRQGTRTNTNPLWEKEVQRAEWKLNEVVVGVQSVLQRQLVSSEKQKHFMNTPP